MFGALVDTAIGAAVFGGLKGEGAAVTIEFKVNLCQPGRLGDVLTARAEVLHLGRATAAGIGEAIAGGRTAPVLPAYTDFDAYAEAGGYTLLRDCRAGRRTVEHNDPNDHFLFPPQSSHQGLLVRCNSRQE